MPKRSRKPSFVSVVIPVFNENESVELLANNLDKILPTITNDEYEVIFVDDGSTDSTWGRIAKITKENSRVKGLRLRRNFGKAIALSCGFSQAEGEIIVTMDGDLQDDPTEIPRLISKIEEGFDLVNGWKENRHDPWHKVIPSKIFNTMTTKLFALEIRDINSGYKAYRKELAKQLNLYGELHRFVPVLAVSLGYSVTEIPVKHHPRQFGVSKYGASRFVRGFLDIITVLTLTKFKSRPSHFIGGIGLLFGILGALSLIYLFWLWLFGIRPIGDRPLLLFGVMCVVLSVQLLSLGVLSELIISNSKQNFGVYVSEFLV